MKIALVIVAVTDLTGSGGAERLFIDLHQYFGTQPSVDVSLVTSTDAVAALRAVGRLPSLDRVVALDLGSRATIGAWRVARTTARLLSTIAAKQFDLVHICLPTPSYVPLAATLTRLPRSWRPAVALNVIDCTVATSLDVPPAVGTYERQVLDAHQLYFRWTRLDGLYSWYRSAVDAIAKRRLAPGAVLASARYCFTDTSRFAPAATKDDLVIFAGRLSEQKRPLLFVDAIARLRQREPDLASKLRVEMYGKGILEASVRERIARHGLDGFVKLTHAADMAPVFARSRLFVSTQAIENFTSLAMLEAMAAGNAVIAADVGQTREFVHDGENGVLTCEETADGFALAIAHYLRHPERYAAMALASRAIATELQTIEHFAADIVSFWSTVIDRRAGGA
jgi:glycosyltransferase involved in cell wall biosynthesis